MVGGEGKGVGNPRGVENPLESLRREWKGEMKTHLWWVLWDQADPLPTAPTDPTRYASPTRAQAQAAFGPFSPRVLIPI